MKAYQNNHLMVKTAFIAFSFDDGRLDNYTIAYPILQKYNIPATFNITTGYIEGKIEDGKLTKALPMTIDMIKELYKNINCEIAGHGYWHQNTLDDILKGTDGLKEDLGLETWGGQVGFASPGTSLDLNYYQTIKQALQNHDICYVRLSKRYLSSRRIKILCRKAARIFHVPCLFRLAYQDTLMSEIKDNIIYSVPILASTTVREIQALVGKAVREKKACVLMWHSIVKKEDLKDNFGYDVEKFEKICCWLMNMHEQGKITLCKTMDLYNQMRC